MQPRAPAIEAEQDLMARRRIARRIGDQVDIGEPGRLARLSLSAAHDHARSRIAALAPAAMHEQPARCQSGAVEKALGAEEGKHPARIAGGGIDARLGERLGNDETTRVRHRRRGR